MKNIAFEELENIDEEIGKIIDDADYIKTGKIINDIEWFYDFKSDFAKEYLESHREYIDIVLNFAYKNFSSDYEEYDEEYGEEMKDEKWKQVKAEFFLDGILGHLISEDTNLYIEYSISLSNYAANVLDNMIDIDVYCPDYYAFNNEEYKDYKEEVDEEYKEYKEKVDELYTQLNEIQRKLYNFKKNA